MPWQYYMPTKVIVGEKCILAQAAQLLPLGKKALIVTGRHSAKACGALDDILAALSRNGQEYALYDKVLSNPTIPQVYEGAAFARKSGADFLIAIGGGSPMDAGKAIALLSRQDISEESLFSGAYGLDVLPMALVPTTAGTGSEVTQYAVLTNDRIQSKSSLSAPQLFPRLSFLDARYTKKLPPSTTIHTAVDALSHAVEGMLSVRASQITDGLAQKAIAMIADCFSQLLQGELTTKYREQLLVAANIAGMVIANTGTTTVHAMGYSLTYFKDTDHGRANGLLLPAYLGYVEKRFPSRVRQILGSMGLASVEAFSDRIGCLLGEEPKLSEAEIEKFAGLAALAKNIPNSIAAPVLEELKELYRESLG